MPHNIRNRAVKTLVMIDHGDMLLRVVFLYKNCAPTVCNSLCSLWISVFDATVYVIVDSGSNLSTEYMKTKLHEVESQLGPVPTNSPWVIGLSERSHRCLHKSIDRILMKKYYYAGDDHRASLQEVETAWNIALHNNNVLPHYQCLGIMLRFIRSLDEFTWLAERVAPMDLASRETECLTARYFIYHALAHSRRNIVPILSFAIQEMVWFHRHFHGWRHGTVASIDHPTPISSLSLIASFNLLIRLVFVTSLMSYSASAQGQ